MPPRRRALKRRLPAEESIEGDDLRPSNRTGGIDDGIPQAGGGHVCQIHSRARAGPQGSAGAAGVSRQSAGKKDDDVVDADFERSVSTVPRFGARPVRPVPAFFCRRREAFPVACQRLIPWSTHETFPLDHSVLLVISLHSGVPCARISGSSLPHPGRLGNEHNGDDRRHSSAYR